jgi:hypothetical protein
MRSAVWSLRVSLARCCRGLELTFATAMTCRPLPRPLEAPSMIPGKSSTVIPSAGALPGGTEELTLYLCSVNLQNCIS